MKILPKQIAIAILCIIIAFIPTYIAITYYFVKDGAPANGNYTVSIIDEKGTAVSLEGTNKKKLAETVLKLNKKMYAPDSEIDASVLPERYFDITVSSAESTASFRYYFSTNENEKTLVYEKSSNKYYLIDFKDAKPFLSFPCAHSFYSNSNLPTLSIFGGDDITPTEANWKYKNVSGDMVQSKSYKTSESASIHAMNSNTKLSFSIAPDRCSVKVTQNGKIIAEGDGLSCIPYDKLDGGSLSFEIFAEWTSSKEYSGYAKYRFTSTVGLTPEFFIDKTSIQSGEFVLIYARNVSAPQKIEFSSSPSINYTPVFFEENGIVYTLIPIDKNLEAPQQYTFRFKYGDTTSEATISVEQREIPSRDYDCLSITSNRTAAEISEYNQLLNDIGLKYEATRYFNDKFIDYDIEYSDVAKTIHGYGYLRVPNNGDAPFRLDGVDHWMAAGTNVTAIASGKVVYIGTNDLLGKFVVIDHGLGLKTWYCGLSEVSTTVDATVTKGDAIGKPGMSGYKNTRGVYLITTIMNVPICPYSLQKDGLTLPK